MQVMGIADYEVLRAFKASELKGLLARHPFWDRDSVLILGTHVTLEAGTGLGEDLVHGVLRREQGGE